jgi:hypothetical protein
MKSVDTTPKQNRPARKQKDTQTQRHRHRHRHTTRHPSKQDVSILARKLTWWIHTSRRLLSLCVLSSQVFLTPARTRGPNPCVGRTQNEREEYFERERKTGSRQQKRENARNVTRRNNTRQTNGSRGHANTKSTRDVEHE